MATTTALAEVLNDLNQTNYDRIEGYRKAAEDCKDHDIDLHPVFQRMADVSRLNVSALTGKIRAMGVEVESGSTTMGKLYHAWMDVKATFTGKDRKAILAACEFGEDQAQKAYDKALASDADIDAATRKMIMDQKDTLQRQQNEIKAMRDQAGKAED